MPLFSSLQGWCWSITQAFNTREPSNQSTPRIRRQDRQSADATADLAIQCAALPLLTGDYNIGITALTCDTCIHMACSFYEPGIQLMFPSLMARRP
jgi:hypothetical protein